ncbi:hypothetical protein DP939_30805 [Spongiactinospora rosea]|uniref:Lipoprotein n=1 Tax=Spongiactinospora rosea TaxID=2248750 RepID=A0A366LT17_9ACTN|nr:hypothetical protein [Spongiactinospora rosea]RBQ16352.1 hypothetical protein DP939_30805 [Spongiactinospora rosea]
MCEHRSTARRLGGVLAVAGVVWTSAGCGPAAGPAATPGTGAKAPAGAALHAERPAGVPEGFKRVGDATNGVTVSVPREWATLDLGTDDLDKGLAAAGLSGRAIREAKSSLRDLAAGNAVWASDPASIRRSATRFATNLNGFCRPGGAVAADDLINVAKDRLHRLDATVTEAGEVPLDQGRGVRIVYMFASGGVRVHGTQYYVPGAGKTCIVTLSTDQQDRQPLFDRIGRTVRPV